MQLSWEIAIRNKDAVSKLSWINSIKGNSSVVGVYTLTSNSVIDQVYYLNVVGWVTTHGKLMYS